MKKMCVTNMSKIRHQKKESLSGKGNIFNKNRRNFNQNHSPKGTTFTKHKLKAKGKLERSTDTMWHNMVQTKLLAYGTAELERLVTIHMNKQSQRKNAWS